MQNVFISYAILYVSAQNLTYKIYGLLEVAADVGVVVVFHRNPFIIIFVLAEIRALSGDVK